MAFSGVIVGLFLRPTDAQQLALPGGEHPDDLHITLAYLGDKEDLSEETLGKLPCIVEFFSLNIPPIDAKISGLGRFTSVPDGERTPLYASVGSRPLAKYHHYLCMLLHDYGCPISTEHGFTPHITLDYLEPWQPIPGITPPPLDIRFDAVTLAVAGERTSYVLRG